MTVLRRAIMTGLHFWGREQTALVCNLLVLILLHATFMEWHDLHCLKSVRKHYVINPTGSLNAIAIRLINEHLLH